MTGNMECWIDGSGRAPSTLEAELGRRCIALMEAFGLHLAFAARSTPDGGLRLVAHACTDSAQVKEILEADLRWSGGAAIPCLVEAVRTRRPYVCRDLPVCCRLHMSSRFAGGAVCVVPLVAADELFGVMVLCGPADAAFDAPLGRALLDEPGLGFDVLADRSTAAARIGLLGRALAAVADAVFITDRDAVIEWVNDAFVALTGYAREDVIGRTPRMLQSGLHGDDEYRLLKATIRAGKIWSGELTNRRKDGSLYTVRQTITPLLEGNRRVRHFVAVHQDLTERTRLERELHEARQDAEEAARRERGRLARELHDELGGALVSLKHDIEWLVARNGDPATRERLELMLELAQHALSGARRIASGLRPDVVDELGFPGALAWLAREFGQHRALRIELDLEPGLAQVEGAQAVEAYRVVQESLTNVAKHASAGEVRITGRIEAGRLVLEVADDGTGTPPGTGASGTQGMSERALRLGGYLDIERGRGTRVRLVVPLGGKEQA